MIRNILRKLRELIGHEPNDLLELDQDFSLGLPDDLAAVVIVYRSGAVSWYAEDEKELDNPPV